MKRLSDMTIRERGRWLYSKYAIVSVALLIFGLVLQHWIIIVCALGAGVATLVAWLSIERKTRDDPPHANY